MNLARICRMEEMTGRGRGRTLALQHGGTRGISARMNYPMLNNVNVPVERLVVGE